MPKSAKRKAGVYGRGYLAPDWLGQKSGWCMSASSPKSECTGSTAGRAGISPANPLRSSKPTRRGTPALVGASQLPFFRQESMNAAAQTRCKRGNRGVSRVLSFLKQRPRVYEPAVSATSATPTSFSVFPREPLHSLLPKFYSAARAGRDPSALR